MRDNEVIAAADRLNLAMVFTSMRHFFTLRARPS
jgi:AICAR transformylase/IMP cyclohydrolase PurH